MHLLSLIPTRSANSSVCYYWAGSSSSTLWRYYLLSYLYHHSLQKRCWYTDFMIQWNFYGPGTLLATDRVTRSDIDLQTTLMFDPLAMNDNGTYECFATVISTSLSQYPHVIASDTIMNNTMICISSKSSTINIKWITLINLPLSRIASSSCDHYIQSFTNSWSETYSQLKIMLWMFLYWNGSLLTAMMSLANQWHYIC